MPSMPWIKLYTDILDDPKIGRMDAAEKWHFVALCVLAGECDAEGYLVNGDDPLTIEDIAWRLREDIEQLDHTMTVLQQHGLVTQDPDGTWFVTNFSKRQGRSQSEKRKLWRERKRRQREREQGDPNEDDGSHDGTPENVTRDTAENHAGVTPLEGEEREREIESREDSSRVPERNAPASQPPANAGATRTTSENDGNGQPRAPTEHQTMFSALADFYRLDIDIITKDQRGRLNAESARLRKKYGAEDVQRAMEWWYRHDWRGKRGDKPSTYGQVVEALSASQRASPCQPAPRLDSGPQREMQPWE